MQPAADDARVGQRGCCQTANPSSSSAATQCVPPAMRVRARADVAVHLEREERRAVGEAQRGPP